MTQIASGYTVQPNPAAVIVGPGGLAYNSKNDTLYVAATGNNEIFAIPHASRTHSDQWDGHAGLSGAVAPPRADRPGAGTQRRLAHNQRRRGQLLNESSNQPSELIEFTPAGQFIGELSLDPGVQGAAFQVVALKSGQTILVATVNDGTNSLDMRTVNVRNL